MKGSGAFSHELAVALWREAGSGASADAAEKAVAAAAEAVRASPRFRALLLNPALPLDRRTAMLLSAVKAEGPAETLLKTVVARGAVGILPGLLREFRSLRAARATEAEAVVETAQALSAADEKRLGAILEKAAGRPVRLSVKAKPSLLGGLVIRLGETVVDGSVLGAFARLERALQS